MAKRMLIDATHTEETRVVVVDGKKLEEFDFESSTKRQLKGNVYLAKVTRVEPSLQAAFVEYGGNRHGFLAFNEIHPDYYQIPVSDRKALIAQQRKEAAADEDERGAPREPAAAEDDDAEPVETVSGQEQEEIARRPATLPRYRIQEVIRRRQILLVQVTKEERGTKGAALTTYISLAGRYCVLMPNTTRGGGISRKIQSGEARKRLRSVVASLSLSEGMAVILRTAGQERTKAEIRRDFEYLMRLWDEIRESTLKATAPALIHEEANLIRRSIRDLYDSKMVEVLVEGDEGYRVAKDFMRTLMPSHAKRVQPYKDGLPLFTRYQVDSQLDTMHNATVELPSGGYVVFDPTEALVAIDVNSGRSTRERNIEETATATNLEAADEIARQLRLRDLAGLIVIDFIDMEEHRNVRAVEKRLKEAVQSDRARIQMGRISSFGLLELSRQRLRPSLLEASSVNCQHCAGTGRVRSVESIALHALRVIEDEGIRGRAAGIQATMPSPVALYLLNNKRAALAEIESRYGISVRIATDDSPAPPTCRIELVTPRTEPVVVPAVLAEAVAAEMTAETAEKVAEEPGRRRRRRRAEEPARPAGAEADEAEAAEEEAEAETGEFAGEAEAEAGEGEARPRRRRRGRRGGRRRSRTRETEAAAEPQHATADGGEPGAAEPAGEAEGAVEPVAAADAEASIVKPKRRRRTRKTARTGDGEAGESAPVAAAALPAVEPVAASVPEASDGGRATAGNGANGGHRAEARPAQQAVAFAGPAAGGGESGAEGKAEPDDDDTARRRGWWQRLTGV